MVKHRDCLKKPRNPVVALRLLDILRRRRHATDRSHALTPEEIEASKTFKYISPFRVSKSKSLLSYLKFNDHKEKAAVVKLRGQSIYWKAQQNIKDFSKRSFIKDEPDDVKTVREIHPEFFTSIEGRPIRGYEDIKAYMNNIRSYAMARQQLGYRQNFVIKLDKDAVIENNKYDNINKELKEYIKHFQKFLTEDYKKTVAKVDMAAKIYEQVVAKNIELITYINLLTTVRNTLYGWDSLRNVLKIYRKFMLFAAPLPWRQQYDESLTNRVQSIQFEEGSFNAPDQNELLQATDIDNIVSEARIELKNILPAHMYFTEPQQMLNIFRNMEMQSRDYMTQLSVSSVPQRMLRERIKELKASTQFEHEYFLYFIDKMNHDIVREEYNEKYLKDKFFRIIDSVFWECIAGQSSLKLKICVEYVYEQIFGKCEEGHENLREPAKNLEVFFEDYNLRIDALDFQIVKEARSEMYEQDIVMMTNAYQAERALYEFQMMTNAMKKAFLPPAKFQRPILKKYKKKQKLKKLAVAQNDKTKLDTSGGKVKARSGEITPDEREALMLFTEWCDGQNPGPFLKDYQTYVEPVLNMAPRQPNAY